MSKISYQITEKIYVIKKTEKKVKKFYEHMKTEWGVL